MAVVDYKAVITIRMATGRRAWRKSHGL